MSYVFNQYDFFHHLELFLDKNFFFSARKSLFFHCVKSFLVSKKDKIKLLLDLNQKVLKKKDA